MSFAFWDNRVLEFLFLDRTLGIALKVILFRAVGLSQSRDYVKTNCLCLWIILCLSVSLQSFLHSPKYLWKLIRWIQMHMLVPSCSLFLYSEQLMWADSPQLWELDLRCFLESSSSTTVVSFSSISSSSSSWSSSSSSPSSKFLVLMLVVWGVIGQVVVLRWVGAGEGNSRCVAVFNKYIWHAYDRYSGPHWE